MTPSAGAVGRDLCAVAVLTFALRHAETAGAQARLRTPEISRVAPMIYVVADSSGTLLVRVGAKESVVVGTFAPRLTQTATRLLDSLHAPAVRFAIPTASDSAAVYGDGGWTASGAFALAHENLRYAMMNARRAQNGAPSAPTPPRGAVPGAGFSEVVQLALSGDELHLVHQPPAFSNADIIAHFEIEGVVFLGNVYTSDGYPEIVNKSGSIDGMISVVESFVKNFGTMATMVYVPGRGSSTSVGRLREYLGMLRSVRTSVQDLIRAGRTNDDVVNAHVTAPFDGVWGKGPVSPKAFAAMVYQSLVDVKKP